MSTETTAERAKYQIMPPLSDEEYDALETSIAENGVLTPILVDEDDNVIDGHHRAKIAKKLGLSYERKVVRELTGSQKIQMALTLNVDRRHLTREQRRELVAKSIRATPELSDREHARRTGVSDKTAGVVRKDLEANAEIPHSSERREVSGRVARGAKTKHDKNTKPESAPATNDNATGGTATNCEAMPDPRANIADELDHIASNLERVREQILQLGQRVMSLSMREDYERDIERELVFEAVQLIEAVRSFGEQHSDDAAAEIVKALTQASSTLNESVQHRLERRTEAAETSATG